MSEHALVAVVQEANVHGRSASEVDDLVQAQGMTGISKSQVLTAEEGRIDHGTYRCWRRNHE